jgi:hypothetical protein
MTGAMRQAAAAFWSHVSCVTNPPRVCSAQAEIGKDDSNDDNKADDINNGVHGFLLFRYLKNGALRRSQHCIQRSLILSSAALHGM